MTGIREQSRESTALAFEIRFTADLAELHRFGRAQQNPYGSKCFYQITYTFVLSFAQLDTAMQREF